MSKNNHVWAGVRPCRHPELVRRAYPHPSDSQVTMSARHCTKCSYRDEIRWNGMSWGAYKMSLGLGESITYATQAADKAIIDALDGNA